MVTYLRRTFEPLWSSPYHITRQYVRELAEGMAALRPHILAKDSGFVPLQQELIFMNRLQFGFYSVLARLDVEIDYAAVEERFFREAGL
jgi:hypothetical protein